LKKKGLIMADLNDVYILKAICGLCRNDITTCKYFHDIIIKSGKVCKYFKSNYSCDACDKNIDCMDKTLCVSFVPNELVIESNKEHPIEKSITDTLYDLLSVEKSTHKAVVKFKQSLEANGIQASIRDAVLKRYIDNLLALYFLDKTIDLYGLEKFKAKIINNEIDRLFEVVSLKKQNSKNE